MLKNCPFCNSEASSGIHSALSYAVTCDNPDCQAKIVVEIPDEYPPDTNEDTIWRWCTQKAESRWNTRFYSVL